MCAHDCAYMMLLSLSRFCGRVCSLGWRGH